MALNISLAKFNFVGFGLSLQPTENTLILSSNILGNSPSFV